MNDELTLAELRTKLFTRMARERWEVWLWADAAWNSKRGGWVILQGEDGRTSMHERADAIAGLQTARKTYGKAALLRLMHWTAEEDAA